MPKLIYYNKWFHENVLVNTAYFYHIEGWLQGWGGHLLSQHCLDSFRGNSQEVSLILKIKIQLGDKPVFFVVNGV